MSEPVIESVTKHETPEYQVRVWREQAEVMEYYPDTHEIDDALGPVHHMPLRYILEALRKLDRVNAIEVTRHIDGDGTVFYTRWP
jgi:hypothetical protein